jgi:hypothetical protein
VDNLDRDVFLSHASEDNERKILVRTESVLEHGQSLWIARLLRLNETGVRRDGEGACLELYTRRPSQHLGARPRIAF